MEWFKQFNNAIEYIENNLTNEISYEEAAKIACCSINYFQRMFSYITGISLSEYIRRRRMTQAAFEIQLNKKKIMDIAVKYGYASPSSFNRAFQYVHGISPTDARKQGILLNTYLPIKFAISVIGDYNIKYHIEDKEAIRIVGIRTKLKNNTDENFKIVPNFWNSVLKDKSFLDICQLCNQAPYGVLGVSVYINDNIYYYISASTDKEVPDNMMCYEIPPAKWVVIECNGDFKESIQSMFKRFLTQWLPFSGYRYAELPDIEVYPLNSQNLKSGRSEIWIAIKMD